MTKPRPLYQRLHFWIAVVVVVLILFVLLALGICWAYGWAVDKWTAEGVWRGVGQFLTSAGFGGLMAAVAGTLALFGILSQVWNARDIARDERTQKFTTTQQEKWWEQAHWAMNLVLDRDGDDNTRRVGHQSLEALLKVDERYIPSGAAAVVAVVTDDALGDLDDIQLDGDVETTQDAGAEGEK